MTDCGKHTLHGRGCGAYVLIMLIFLTIIGASYLMGILK